MNKTWLRQNARRLRSNATPFEHDFWYAVRAHRFAGFKFRRQQILGPYIVDFVCLQTRLVIELDGSQHANAHAADHARDEWLHAEGYRVFRVWNHEWAGQQEAVLERLWQLLHETTPSPQPLSPKGRGARPSSRLEDETKERLGGRHLYTRLRRSPLPSPLGGEGLGERHLYTRQRRSPLPSPLGGEGLGERVRRLHLTLSGLVQGVGFRPFVHRLAHELSLGGWVQNQSGQVVIEVEGAREALATFRQRLIHDAPPLAAPEIIDAHTHAISQARHGFAILSSQASASADIHLPPDTHLCADCQQELFDPANRRYRYPFINCTQCGPRYTLIAALPYDRARTTLAGFPLCPACRAEYENPAERRFHAEPLACPQCGPHLHWHPSAEALPPSGEAALQAALAALRAGQIIAVRGVGAYHLMCDARNATAVSQLRLRKQRPTRPFALLFHDSSMLFDALRPTPAELTLLRSPQRPIVLITAQPNHSLAANIAPGMSRIGAMLPHSPLQALLVQDFGGPLIATSGNLSGEPVCLDPSEAESRLGGIADGFLHHNRPILRPAEDSVWHIPGPHPSPLRLGRGDAPQEWRLPGTLAHPTLALGGEQKVCVALGWGDRAVISPHIGDLAHPESLEWLTRIAADLCSLYQVQPTHIALDAHPHYHSRRWAEARGLALINIWHHHAHASALAAEHPGISQWLMHTWDGVGLGPDGSLWGGEWLLGRPGHWQRVARLRPFRLPGGEEASRECWRSAAGLLWEAGLPCPRWHEAIDLLQNAWQQQLNSPATSAIGRLFDAAAALLGVCDNASFEGEGPMRLQALAETVNNGPCWPIVWRRTENLWELDWQPWLTGLLDAHTPVAQRAWALHDALARASLELSMGLDLQAGTALGGTGGVFQNSLLVDRLQQRFSSHPLQLILPKRHAANDAGLALGQLQECLHAEHA